MQRLERLHRLVGKGLITPAILTTLGGLSVLNELQLLKRKANVMHSHFIEAIFHFNDYEVRKAENHLVIAANVRKHSLSGPPDVQQVRHLRPGEEALLDARGGQQAGQDQALQVHAGAHE